MSAGLRCEINPELHGSDAEDEEKNLKEKPLPAYVMVSIAERTCVTAMVVVVTAGGAAARVAGKMGGYSNKKGGKSTSGINEEIIWISISMAIAIAVLIAIALCYILKQKCAKRQAYREQS